MEGLPKNPAFTTTQWTLVLRAKGDSTQAAESLAKLCAVYWYPLYAFVRHRGFSREEAEDLTQGFFARLLKGNFLDHVDPAKGRFRSFLLASFKNFLASEWAKSKTLKRGGDCAILSVDSQDGEDRYKLEPSHNLTPEKLFERRWAMTVLDQAFEILRKEFKDRLEWFEALKGVLIGEPSESSYRDLAEKLQTSEGAIKVAVHRLRQRFGAALRQVIADTITPPADSEEEIRNLIQALRS